jgi:hypothetical protein
LSAAAVVVVSQYLLPQLLTEMAAAAAALPFDIFLRPPFRVRLLQLLALLVLGKFQPRPPQRREGLLLSAHLLLQLAALQPSRVQPLDKADSGLGRAIISKAEVGV